MRHVHRNFLLAAGIGACTLSAALVHLVTAAWSQSGAIIKIVVPYPPGGGADVVARVMANAIGNMQGQTFVVENRPGASTKIGTTDVVRAAPDGKTLLLANNAILLLPHLRKLDFDPLTNFVPICIVASTPTVLVVNSTSPYYTLHDLLNAARAKPGEVTFGATPGAVTDVSVEMLLHPESIHMTLVPFNGTAPQVNAVLGGQIDTAFVDYPAAAGLLQARKLRALAAGSRKRTDALPGVPTVSEYGPSYTNFEMVVWYAVLAPGHTPEQTILQLTEWFTKAVQAPDTRSRLSAQGMEAGGDCGAPLAANLRKQFDTYGSIIRAANIQAE